MATQTRANPQKLDPSAFSEMLGGSWTSGRGPLYRRLADRIDELIESADLRDGTRLPPERELASALAVSRSTVVSSLDLLRQRGSVKSRQGSGSQIQGPTPPNQNPALFRARSLFQSDQEPCDLTKACPAMLPEVEATVQRILASELALDGSMDPEGTPALREKLARYYTDNGLATDPDEIAVTSGAQQAMSLTLSVLCRPGDVVLVEATTWPGITDSISRLGGRAIGVAVDANGIDTAELRSAVERFRPAAIALNPHHHNPTASRLSPRRRTEVAQISAEYRVPVIEDRVAARLAFDGVVPKPLVAERPDASLIVVDSLSKTLWPGLRLGWIRAPRSVLSEFRMAKAIHDMWTSNLTQVLAGELLDVLDELLVHRVAHLQRQRDVAIDALRTEVPEWSFDTPLGGMVLWAELPTGHGRNFVAHAASQGILLARSDAFSVEGDHPDRVRIPYTDPPETLVANLTRLGEGWRSFDPDRAPGPLPQPTSII